MDVWPLFILRSLNHTSHRPIVNTYRCLPAHGAMSIPALMVALEQTTIRNGHSHFPKSFHICLAFQKKRKVMSIQ